MLGVNSSRKDKKEVGKVVYNVDFKYKREGSLLKFLYNLLVIKK